MIVVDASVVVHLLLLGRRDPLTERVARSEPVAPAVIDLEVLNTLRP